MVAWIRCQLQEDRCFSVVSIADSERGIAATALEHGLTDAQLPTLIPAGWLPGPEPVAHRTGADILTIGKGWTTQFSSDDLDDWRLRVGHLLGPHEIHRLEATPGQRFHHRIRSASLGALQLVEFRGGGRFELDRIQAPDRAVLWLPSLGVVEERVEGCRMQPHPGMGLWIRPGTALVGRIDGRCGGISIVVPTALLEPDDGQEYRADAEAGPMLLNPFSRQRSGAVVTLLRLARQLVQAVKTGGSTLQTLTDCLIEQLQAWDRVEPWSGVRLPRAEQHCREAEDWILRHRDRAISVADVAAALHLSQRTLQASFRAERDMSPVEAIRRLQLRAAAAPASGSGAGTAPGSTAPIVRRPLVVRALPNTSRRIGLPSIGLISRLAPSASMI